MSALKISLLYMFLALVWAIGSVVLISKTSSLMVEKYVTWANMVMATIVLMSALLTSASRTLRQKPKRCSMYGCIFNVFAFLLLVATCRLFYETMRPDPILDFKTLAYCMTSVAFSSSITALYTFMKLCSSEADDTLSLDLAYASQRLGDNSFFFDVSQTISSISLQPSNIWGFGVDQPRPRPRPFRPPPPLEPERIDCGRKDCPVCSSTLLVEGDDDSYTANDARPLPVYDLVSEKKEQCPICMNNTVDLVTGCGHKFCWMCVKGMKDAHVCGVFACPMCRHFLV